MKKIKKAAIELKNKLTMSSLERQILEILGEESWGIESSVLEDLSERTNNREELKIITKAIVAQLSSPSTEIRSLFKTLMLVEYLVQRGSGSAVIELSDNAHTIGVLANYSSENTQLAQDIREKAQYLSHILSDLRLLDKVRGKAKKPVDHFDGFLYQKSPKKAVKDPFANLQSPQQVDIFVVKDPAPTVSVKQDFDLLDIHQPAENNKETRNVQGKFVEFHDPVPKTDAFLAGISDLLPVDQNTCLENSFDNETNTFPATNYQPFQERAKDVEHLPLFTTNIKEDLPTIAQLKLNPQPVLIQPAQFVQPVQPVQHQPTQNETPLDLESKLFDLDNLVAQPTNKKRFY